MVPLLKITWKMIDMLIIISTIILSDGKVLKKITDEEKCPHKERKEYRYNYKRYNYKKL